jgi:hypothetical protein
VYRLFTFTTVFVFDIHFWIDSSVSVQLTAARQTNCSPRLRSTPSKTRSGGSAAYGAKYEKCGNSRRAECVVLEFVCAEASKR